MLTPKPQKYSDRGGVGGGVGGRTLNAKRNPGPGFPFFQSLDR